MNGIMGSFHIASDKAWCLLHRLINVLACLRRWSPWSAGASWLNSQLHVTHQGTLHILQLPQLTEARQFEIRSALPHPLRIARSSGLPLSRNLLTMIGYPSVHL